MKAPAPMSAKAPGSTHDQGLGGRNTPSGALQKTDTLKRFVCGPPHLTNLFSAADSFWKMQALMTRALQKKITCARRLGSSAEFQATFLFWQNIRGHHSKAKGSDCAQISAGASRSVP